jgi:hypothetical protein
MHNLLHDLTWLQIYLFVPNTFKLIYSCVRKMRHLMLTDFEDASSYLNQLKLKIIWINRHMELWFLNWNGIWVAKRCCDKYNMLSLLCTIYSTACMILHDCKYIYLFQILLSWYTLVSERCVILCWQILKMFHLTLISWSLKLFG